MPVREDIKIRSQADFDRAVGEVYLDWRNIDYRPFLDDMVDKLEELHDQYFLSETGPGPNRWPELAPSTIARKGHDTILVDTGRLKNSLIGRTEDSIREIYTAENHHGVEFGTDVPYSEFHHTGTSNIPARPHVGLSAPDLDGITEQVLDFQLTEMLSLVN